MVLVLWCILSLLFSIGHSSPIAGGVDVGKLNVEGEKQWISGQTEFPFMAHLKIFETELSEEGGIQIISRCGGVIISRIAVLTAGHCIRDVEAGIEQEVFVRAGLVHLDYERGQIRKMSMQSRHEEYFEVDATEEDPSEYCFNDITIVWLQKPFIFGSTVNAAVLSDPADNLDNIKGWIIGWGVNENTARMRMLQKASMKVVSNTVCEAVNGGITDDMICLFSEGKPAASCLGDSGGPFIAHGKLYGIASINSVVIENGREICDKNAPVVYTNVAAYKNWILEKLKMGPPLPPRSENSRILV